MLPYIAYMDPMGKCKLSYVVIFGYGSWVWIMAMRGMHCVWVQGMDPSLTF